MTEMNRAKVLLTGIIIGLIGAWIIMAGMATIEKTVPVTIVVDENIAWTNPNWINDTGGWAAHSSKLITGQRVRYNVVRQLIWQPALVENKSSLDFYRESDEKLNKLDENLKSREGEIVLILTREMLENVYETHDVRSENSANYLTIKYPDYLDEYQNSSKREEVYKRYGLYTIQPKLDQIAIYAINR